MAKSRRSMLAYGTKEPKDCPKACLRRLGGSWSEETASAGDLAPRFERGEGVDGVSRIPPSVSVHLTSVRQSEDRERRDGEWDPLSLSTVLQCGQCGEDSGREILFPAVALGHGRPNPRLNGQICCNLAVVAPEPLLSPAEQASGSGRLHRQVLELFADSRFRIAGLCAGVLPLRGVRELRSGFDPQSHQARSQS